MTDATEVQRAPASTPPAGAMQRLRRLPRRTAGTTGRARTPTVERTPVRPTTCFNCSPPAGCWPMSTRRPVRRKFGATRSRAAAAGTAKGPDQTRRGSERIRNTPAPGERAAPAAGSAAWDKVLDDLAGGSAPLVRDEPVQGHMHVGRQGEDGFTERIWRHGAWIANSHTNICPAGGSATRSRQATTPVASSPTPDILLISAHSERHYQPPRQRIMGRSAGQALVIDPRLNTTAQADHCAGLARQRTRPPLASPGS